MNCFPLAEKLVDRPSGLSQNRILRRRYVATYLLREELSGNA